MNSSFFFFSSSILRLFFCLCNLTYIRLLCLSLCIGSFTHLSVFAH